MPRVGSGPHRIAAGSTKRQKSAIRIVTAAPMTTACQADIRSAREQQETGAVTLARRQAARMR